MASSGAAGAVACTTCQVPDDIVDAFKKFKSRKNPANCAIILAINKNELIVEIEDTLEVVRREELVFPLSPNLWRNESRLLFI
jgi:hypothetical protein